MDHQEILATYEAIARITGEMAAAASHSQWERLATLETTCRAHTTRLMGGERDTPLPADLQQRKALLLRQILADDAHIRSHTQSWMNELQKLIGTSAMARKLDRSYRD